MLVLTAYYLGSEIPQRAIVCQVCGWVIEFRHLGQNSASANIDGQFGFFPIFAIEMKLVVIPTLPDGRDRPPNHLLPSSSLCLIECPGVAKCGSHPLVGHFPRE